MLAGCDIDDEEEVEARVDAGAPSGSPQTLTFISSRTGDHAHSVRIRLTDITDPSPEGIRETTSVDEGHAHTLVLRREELDAIDEGRTVTKETTLDAGHTHTFTLSKASAIA